MKSRRDIDALFVSAQQNYQEGNYQEVNKICKQVIKLDDKNHQAFHLLGMAALRIPMYEEAVVCLQRAIDLQPTVANYHGNIAAVYAQMGEHRKAIKSFISALRKQADMPVYYNNMANSLLSLHKHNSARRMLEKALALNPDYDNAYNNLAAIEIQHRNFKRAYQLLNEVLSKSDYNEYFLYNKAVALYQLGEYEHALSTFDQILIHNPEHADVHFYRGLILLSYERWIAGWEAYNWRFFKAQPTTLSLVDLPIWQGGSLQDRTLLLLAEQDVGQQLLFVGLLKDLLKKSGKIVLECEGRLQDLLQRSFPELNFVTSQALSENTHEYAFDYYLPLGSAGTFIRRETSDFPRFKSYLCCDEKQQNKCARRYKRRLGKLKVGISWQINQDDFKHFGLTLEQLLPVLKSHGVCFINLQPGQDNEALKAFVKKHKIKWINDKTVDPLGNLDAYAAQVAALDLVIAIDNAALVLAAALGVPAWGLLTKAPHFIWGKERGGKKAKSVWFPKVKLYRQKHLDVWDDVIDKVAKDLGNLTNKTQ